jgi:hypothetical protein
MSGQYSMPLMLFALRPNVTIAEEGEVHGLKNLKRLDGPDLFTEVMKDPLAFAQFLQSH